MKNQERVALFIFLCSLFLLFSSVALFKELKSARIVAESSLGTFARVLREQGVKKYQVVDLLENLQLASFDSAIRADLVPLKGRNLMYQSTVTQRCHVDPRQTVFVPIGE